MLFKLVVSQLAVLSTAIPTGTSLKAASAMLEQGTNKTVSALGHSILDECILYDGKEFTHGAELLRSVSLDQKRNYVISILYRGGISQDIPWLQGKSNVWLRDTCKNELIKSPPPPPPYYDSCHDIPTQEGCTGGMCFWADGGCHSDIPAGVTGDKGFTGDQGEQGPRGEKGEAGDAFDVEGTRQLLEKLRTQVYNMGPIKKGPTGDRGPTGRSGPMGEMGQSQNVYTLHDRNGGYTLRYMTRDCSKDEAKQFRQHCDSLNLPTDFNYMCPPPSIVPSNGKSCATRRREHESNPMNNRALTKCLGYAATRNSCCPTHLGVHFMHLYGLALCK